MNPSVDRLRPLYVVHIITGLGSGGAETMLYRLLSQLDNSHFRSRVIVLTRKDALKSRIEALGVPVEVLGADGKLGVFATVFRLARSLRREQPDIVQTWLYHADLLGLVAAKLAGVQRVLWNLRCSTLRPGDVPRSTWMVMRLLAKLSALPDAVVVNSHAGQEAHTVLGYHPRRWVLIPNGFDIERFHPDHTARERMRRALGIDAETLVVGLVGRWHPMKDHANFLTAAAQLKQKVSGVRFVLVGKGVAPDNPELCRLLKVLDLVGDVSLLGERSDVAELTSVFDIAVSASYSEGFPTTLGEAMASAVPCVATDVGDSRLIIGDTGVIVPSRNSAALAAGILQLSLMSDEDRKQLGIVARTRICEQFSVERVTALYAELYEGCL